LESYDMKRLLPHSIGPSIGCPNIGPSSNEQHIVSEALLGSIFILRGCLSLFVRLNKKAFGSCKPLSANSQATSVYPPKI
jgi:hypothetical protein